MCRLCRRGLAGMGEKEGGTEHSVCRGDLWLNRVLITLCRERERVCKEMMSLVYLT